MSDETTNRALDLLEKLAGKMGQTAEQAWPLVVEYARWDAASGALASLVGALILGLAALWLKRAGDRERGRDEFSDGTMEYMFAGLLALGALVVVAASITFLPAIVSPEGYLIRSLLAGAVK